MSPTRRPIPRNRTAAVLALLAFLPACLCGVRTGSGSLSVGAPVTSSPGSGAMAALGPEVWTIEGRPFQIRASYFLVLNGRLQYTADYLCSDHCPELDGLSDDQAFAIAYPVMKHAVTHGLHERIKVQEIEGEPLKTELIGVAITQQTSGGRERGFRVARTLDQLRAAIQAGGPKTKGARP